MTNPICKTIEDDTNKLTEQNKIMKEALEIIVGFIYSIEASPAKIILRLKEVAQKALKDCEEK